MTTCTKCTTPKDAVVHQHPACFPVCVARFVATGHQRARYRIKEAAEFLHREGMEVMVDGFNALDRSLFEWDYTVVAPLLQHQRDNFFAHVAPFIPPGDDLDEIAALCDARGNIVQLKLLEELGVSPAGWWKVLDAAAGEEGSLECACLALAHLREGFVPPGAGNRLATRCGRLPFFIAARVREAMGKDAKAHAREGAKGAIKHQTLEVLKLWIGLVDNPIALMSFFHHTHREWKEGAMVVFDQMAMEHKALAFASTINDPSTQETLLDRMSPEDILAIPACGVLNASDLAVFETMVATRQKQALHGAVAVVGAAAGRRKM